MCEIKNPDSMGRPESLGTCASTTELKAQKSLIDTAAPFDSVKAAVSMFGGVVGWRARKAVGLEKHTDPQDELDRVQEEIPKYKKLSEAAQIAKLQVLEELESTKKLTDELKDRLEKTETEVAQAKHNLELSEIAKAKHEECMEEMKSVREELESLRVDYQRLMTERDLGVASAREALSAAKDAEKKVENLEEELRHLEDKKFLNDLKTRSESTSPPLSSLEAEINKMLELVLRKENEAQKKMANLQKLIEQATHDANEAKLISSSAFEELRNAKEGSEQAEASATAMEAKLLAVVKEIETANSSRALAVAAVKAMLESAKFPMDNGVGLQLEEYYMLTKIAYGVELSGNQELIAAAEKIEEAKKFELMELSKLEQVEKELKERKEAAKAAEETAEKATESRLAAEKELKDSTVVISHRRRASEVVASSYDKKDEIKRRTKRVSSLSCPDFDEHTIPEVKLRKKKSFFPRIVMFLARKKAQSLN